MRESELKSDVAFHSMDGLCVVVSGLDDLSVQNGPRFVEERNSSHFQSDVLLENFFCQDGEDGVDMELEGDRVLFGYSDDFCDKKGKLSVLKCTASVSRIG